jgi:phosphodiesterase/alkaline phosphatase D-like protein
MSTPTPHRSLTRRRFLQNSAALAAGVAASAPLTPLVGADHAPAGSDFTSNWKNCPDRVWLGPELWSNPLQDWRLADGRIECANAAPDRNVHVLVRSLGERAGNFTLRVRIGRSDGAPLGKGAGSVGFRVGIRGPLPDFRNSLIFGRGLDAGVTASGGLFIGSVADAKPGAVALDAADVELQLTGAPAGENVRLKLSVIGDGGRELGALEKDVPRDRCVGGMALVNNFTSPGAGAGKGKAKAAQPAKKANASASPAGLGAFWFADWRISGDQVDAHPDRAFGPLLFSQYTLSGGVMKLSAQLPPLGAGDAPTIRLQFKSGAEWKTIAEAPIHAEARCAAFRSANWDATKDVPYRLAYTLKFRDGKTEEHFWSGTIRRDPVEQPVLSVADISCNIHDAFPNAPYVENVAKLKPDLLAFVGDQFYESSGGYGIIRTPTDTAMIDYLRKWYLHGWTWRELMRDRPSLSLPDDHDVYQGNVWGEGGAAQGPTQESGGYTMPAEWVNVVYRTQTAHHPDPHDPTPGKRGIIQYYGAFTYGRVSFAVLADRQYKSGPEGKVPPTGNRGDHAVDRNFDPKTADVAGLSLLGEKQEEFLRAWVRDWRGAEMKAVISQTIFTSFPTTHGREREVLRADYDSSGWPQTPRNRAVREMRKAFAFHVAGDQHIPGVVQYGIDAHRDGPVAFAGPAINVGYPRWFEPETSPWTQPKQPGLIGDFTDSFGHPMTVLAVKNGAEQPRTGNVMQFLDDKASGLGMVHFDKARRKIRIECWPFLADVTQPSTQFPGWPLEIDVLDNYARKPFGHLPALNIVGIPQPLIEVTEESSGELLYALRVPKPEFRPHVFAAGKYQVRISDPDSGKSATLRGLEPGAANAKPIVVRV